MTRHHAQNEKVLDQFTKQAESYAKLTAVGRGAPPFLDAIAPLGTDRTLDVACGVGRLTLMLAKLTQHVIPLEAVLATSFPLPGDLEKVRALYLADAHSGADTLGLKAEFSTDQITIQYPMTLIVWRR